MQNEKYSKSNLISLILHILLVWGLISIKSAHILTPSRSDGIEVALISSDQIQAPQPVINQPVQPETIKTIENHADINLKQPEKPKEQPKPIEKKIEKPIEKEKTKPAPPPPTPAKVKTKTHKKPNSKVTNSILSQLGNPENEGRSRGKAVGGTQSGTSDSNSMVGDYADSVISAVRPFVEIPEGIDNSAHVIVKVTLLPNLKVYKVQLKRSSGNPAYDASVQDAIKKVAVFPPLPDGAKFVDYRVLYLNFKPE